MSEKLSGYQIKRKFADLPKILRQKLVEMPMVDAGEPFSAACTPKLGEGGVPLPFARMLWAAVAPVEVSNMAYVHYEQGGFAHFYYLAAYDLESTDGEPVWKTMSPDVIGAGSADKTSDGAVLGELAAAIQKQKSDT